MCLLAALSGPGVDRAGADAADGRVLDRLSSGVTSAAAELYDRHSRLVGRLIAGGEATAICRALAELPLLQRGAIELTYFEGLSQREVAERLEETVGTVKTRIRTGMIRLPDSLTRMVTGAGP